MKMMDHVSTLLLKQITYSLIGLSLLFSPSGLYAASWSGPVYGSSNPWLAGMPDGSKAYDYDEAPGQSPVFVGLTLVPGTNVTFTASGKTSYHSYYGGTFSGPEGGGFFQSHSVENGMAGVTAPISALMGVFLDDSQPDSPPAPSSSLDFSSIGLGFTSLSPGLKQVFFIGDGSTGAGTAQHFFVPEGATRLFLGTQDGYGWYDNLGQLTVTVNGVSSVPEPATMLLLGFGLTGIVGLRRTFSVT